MSRLFEALKGAADGVLVVDDDLRICFWNEAAEEILGFCDRDVVGLYCYQILQGKDDAQRMICKEFCPVARLALQAEPVSNFDIDVATNRGGRCWLNMSVLAYKMRENGGKTMIVHLFRDISQKKDDEMFFRRILETARRYHNAPAEINGGRNPHPLINKLTGREREVLILLARGLGTREIAEDLSISRNTTRNHIQRVLQKLQAHSRLEAVTLALKNGLLD